ncbi:MAG: HAD-IB family hydrolase [Gemmatales bacterium]|nr:HAD-IB family hydrolase [Gemmatales bacterium]MDW8387363.1 HAD family hydrolase [Gemmatales bacterium]
MSDARATAAFFDVDGTLTRTTVLHPLIWYQKHRLSRWRFAWWFAGLCLDLPGYVLTDRRNRTDFTRRFYRRYAGLLAEDITRFHRETLHTTFLPRLYREAPDRITWHRQQGHRIILVSGGLDLTLQPLAEYLNADELLCTRLQQRDGRLTGELDGPPMVDEEKAQAMRRCEGINLSQSYAYADSISDLPMLRAAGNPVAVNPDGRLRKVAERERWPIYQWHAA